MEKRDARTIEERCEMYRRQLGGTQKALRRERQRVADRDALIRDLWQGHECGAGCVMYDECLHPCDDRCLMEERITELGLEVGR